jgi:hypothetical protein
MTPEVLSLLELGKHTGRAVRAILADRKPRLITVHDAPACWLIPVETVHPATAAPKSDSVVPGVSHESR